MRALLRQGALPPDIELGYAEALLQTGDSARAKRLLDALAASDDATVSREARELRASRHLEIL